MPIRDAVTQVDGWYATVVEGGQDVQNCKSAIYIIKNTNDMSDEILQNH